MIRIASVAVLVLAACSGSSTPDREVARPSPSVARSIVAGEPCPRAHADESVLQGCLTEARGDFDGDGRADLATVLAELGAGDMPVAWWLIVELTSDPHIDTSQRLRPGESYPRITRAADTDDDGREEVFVDFGEHVEVFGVDREGLYRARRS